jgi:hypothetical protein
MDFDDFRKTLTSPALQAIADHWDEARGSAAMPSWEQLRPARIAPHLSILWSYKYDAAEDAFTGRLAGSAVLWGMQKAFRGSALPDLWASDSLARVHQQMLRVIKGRESYRKTGNLFKHGDHRIEGERMALPLAGDGEHGDGILGASAFRHPYPLLDLGDVEMLDGDEVWFSVTRCTAPIAITILPAGR